MKITVTLNGEELFSGEAREWMILGVGPKPHEIQLAINTKLPGKLKGRRKGK